LRSVGLDCLVGDGIKINIGQILENIG